MRLSDKNESTGKFANFFAHGLKVIKANGHFRIYARSVNQNQVYFLMSHGKIIHHGKRKHILRMWNRYVPLMTSNYMQA